MQVKTVLAATLLLIATSVNAAWDTGAGFETGNGEFILSAWDSTRQLSYTQDLGIRFDQARETHTIAVDPAAFSVFGNDFDGVSWNVAAASNFNNTFTDFTGYGIIASASSSLPAIGFSDLLYSLSRFNPRAAIIGARIGNVNENDTYIATSHFDSTWAGELAWGDDLGQSLPAGTSGINGDLLNLNWLGIDGTTFEGISSLIGTVKFDMDVGQIQFNPVPIPAAAWLFLSGLAGFGAMVRRRSVVASKSLTHLNSVSNQTKLGFSHL